SMNKACLDVRQKRMILLFEFLFLTGLRIGEALALRWENVNLAANINKLCSLTLETATFLLLTKTFSVFSHTLEENPVSSVILPRYTQTIEEYEKK
ncbi:tyrosine-type recombinase/integrase, partial [Lactococcus lactis]